MDFELGRDTNGDECLEPEETELVVGNDCGAWFVRDELTGQEESDRLAMKLLNMTMP